MDLKTRVAWKWLHHYVALNTHQVVCSTMDEPELDVELHIKYWNRCLRSLLPTDYTSTDSSRMTLGFFILAALDLLGAGADTFTPADRDGFKSWILGCAHPNGGFCGSPNHKYRDDDYTVVNWEDAAPANLGATFFALLSLNFVGDLRKVDRLNTLAWLAKLQREDGSFGEMVGRGGNVEGGRDMRYCYLAAAIRYMLRGDLVDEKNQLRSDIDVDKLVMHIQSGEVCDFNCILQQSADLR